MLNSALAPSVLETLLAQMFLASVPRSTALRATTAHQNAAAMTGQEIEVLAACGRHLHACRKDTVGLMVTAPMMTGDNLAYQRNDRTSAERS